MKRLIFQVDIKITDEEHKKPGMRRYRPVDDLYKLSEFRARKYSNIWNTDYFKLTDPSFLPDKHPVFHRLKMYEFDYDQILYLDMDAVILDGCPNPFDLFMNHDFSAVRDRDWDKNTINTQIHRKKINKLYEAKDDYRSFCSGVMLVHRNFLNKTRNHWRDLLYTYDKRGRGIREFLINW